MTRKAHPTLMLPRPRLRSTLIAAIATLPLLAASGTQPPTDPTPSAIIAGIDAAVRARESAVTNYTVQDHYAIYRNGDTNPAAEMTVRTNYHQGSGKSFTTVSESGSFILRSAIINKILASEKEMSGPEVRNSVLVDSDNYEITPEPGTVQQDGHTCILVDLKARRKTPHLFNGKAWVDATDYTVVRLEGIAAQAPSFLAGDTQVSRNYRKVDGYPMAYHAEAHSHTFLFGNTNLQVDSTQYQIELAHP